MKKRIVVSSILIALFILLFQVTTLADTLGKINFKAVDDENIVVTELEVAVYEVGTLENNNFEFTDEFANCGLNVEDLSKQNIDKFEEFAKSNATILETKVTDANGEFTLDNLELGVYLLVQNGREEEYAMQTMLVQLPEVTPEKGFNYTITAKPKISFIEAIGGGDEEDIDLVYEENANLVEDKVLPNTGVLNWPVPVLAITGLVVFCLAWISFYSKKKVK